MTASPKLPQEPVPFSWRIEKARKRLLGAKPYVNIENAAIMTESFSKTEGESYVLRKAKAFEEQCRRKTIRIWDDELIVGQAGKTIRYGLLCPDSCWSIIEKEVDTLSNRKQDPFEITDEDTNLFFEVIKPYWKGKSVLETWQAQRPEDISELTESLSIYVNRKSVRGPGELTAGYDWLLELGVHGIRETIEEKIAALDPTIPGNYDKKIYLTALMHVCDGIVILSNRYADKADEMAGNETNPRRKQELIELSEICRRVPANPARNFHEALQSVWIPCFS